MRKDELKHLKAIKECLKFLRETFPNTEPYQRFYAYLPNDNLSFQRWHIATTDWFLYSGKDESAAEFIMCKEAIYKKFKNIKIIFCYTYHITIGLTKDRGYLTL